MVDPEEPEGGGGPSLDADGRLVGKPAPREEPLFSPADAEVPLELAERAPRMLPPPPESYRAAPPPRRRGPLLAVGAVVVAAAAVAAVLALAPALGPRRPARSGTLVIDSEPSGATIRVGDTVIGRTPWAGDNVWNGAPVTIELEGRRPWKGVLTPGDRTIRAKL